MSLYKKDIFLPISEPRNKLLYGIRETLIYLNYISVAIKSRYIRRDLGEQVQLSLSQAQNGSQEIYWIIH